MTGALEGKGKLPSIASLTMCIMKIENERRMELGDVKYICMFGYRDIIVYNNVMAVIETFCGSRQAQAYLTSTRYLKQLNSLFRCIKMHN